ncbi:MAG: DUF3303 family protein [Candidatus Promineifilaceae bacterium]
MLFHITGTHEPTNCSAHDPERQAAFQKVMQTAESYGITLKGVYTDAPAHTVYILAETNDALAISKLIDPVLAYNHYEIRPVVEAGTLMESLRETVDR